MRVEHFGWPQAVNLTLVDLPADADAQTAATIARMRELAAADAKSIAVRSLADRLPASSERAFVGAVHDYVRRRVRFVRDAAIAPNVGGRGELIEILIRPVDLLTMPDAVGDCDDFSMLAAALLLARGISCSFVTVAADQSDCSRYSHVYVVAHLAEGDVAIDASHGPRVGWEAPNICGKRRFWRVDRMNGLGFQSTAAGGGSSSPVWDLISQGLDIVKGRYGTAENTYIRNPDGSIITRGSGTMAPTGAPVEYKADIKAETRSTTKDESNAWITAGGSSILVIAALVVLALIMFAAVKNSR